MRATRVAPPVGRIATGRIDGLGFKRYLIRLTVPATTRSGRYRLRTCLKVFGRATEQCRSSRRLRVFRAVEN